MTNWFRVTVASLFIVLFFVTGMPGPLLVAQSQDAPESLAGSYTVEMRAENRCHWNYGLIEAGDVNQDVWRFEMRRLVGPGVERHQIRASSTGLPRSAGFGEVTVRGDDYVITHMAIPTDGRESLSIEEVVFRAVGSEYEGTAITHPPASFAGRSCADGIRWSVHLRRL